MGLLGNILNRLGWMRQSVALEAMKAAVTSSRVAQMQQVQAIGTNGVSHPGITVNDLEYSWRHPILFANYNAIATAGMSVPLLVQRMVPTQDSKQAGRYITRATAEHCQRQYAMLAGDAARAAVRTKGLEPEDVDDGHPLRVLLDKVNARSTWREIIYQTLFDCEATGNCYWELVGGKGYSEPVEIWRIRPDRIKVEPSERDVVGGYIYQLDGKEIRLDADEVLHFRYPHPMNDYYGLARGEVLEWPLKTDWNRLAYANKFFENGCQLSQVIVPKGEQSISQDELQRFIDTYNKQHKGVDNMGKIAVLQDFDVVQTGVSPRDAEWLAMADRHDTEIAAVTGVPPMLFKAKEVNRATYEGGMLRFWADTMTPKLQFIAGHLNEFLCPRFGPDLVVEFDFSAIEALSEEATAKVTREAAVFEAGATSIDEFRQAVGYDALPDEAGQRYKRTVAAKFVTLEEDTEPEPEPEPEPQPLPPQFGQPQEQEPNEEAAQAAPEQPEPPPPGKQLVQHRKAIAYGSERHAKLWKAFDTRASKLEDPLIRDIAKWADSLWQGVEAKLDLGKGLKATVPDPDGALFNVGKEGNVLWDMVREASTDAATSEGRRVFGELAVRGMTFDPKNPLVLDHIKSKELLIKTVAKTLHDDLRGIIKQGVASGQPIEKMRQSLFGRFEHLQQYQARRIAQTEVISAMNAGSMAAIEQTGAKKTWVATLDDRTRDSHAAAMDEGAIPADEKFASTGMLRPGDPEGAAEDIINCRCSLAPAFDED